MSKLVAVIALSTFNGPPVSNGLIERAEQKIAIEFGDY